MAKNEKLLKEIREKYHYASTYWRTARDERQKDLRYICGDPWEKIDRDARTDAGRPCVSHDELNQYVNQSMNQLRMNKRGIKVEPSDQATNDQSAELRQGLIRSIEYASNAQAAYLNAAQCMLEGSYGYFRIGRQYVSDDVDGALKTPENAGALFDQEIVIHSIPNPDSVLYDPDVKEPDWSDAEFVFVLEPMSLDDFKRKYPRAEKIGFTPEDKTVAPDWIQAETVLVAEYWKVETTERTVYKLYSGEIVEELPEGEQEETKRVVEEKKVWHYITNGVEILNPPQKPEPGTQIPIPAVIGLERYVDDGKGPQRKLFSLVRLARDPQLTLAYVVSQQMEEAGLSPRSPYVGYVGQFDTDRDAWTTATKVAHSFLQADPIPDSANGQILPLPIRNPFTPNFAAYEVAKDSCRRAVQAAMGISPLPTAAQRDNQKSGVALQRMQIAEQVGSFHFTDGFERALMRAGRIIDSWIPEIYDADDRSVPVRTQDDRQKMVRLNTPEPYQDQNGLIQHHVVKEGSHNITISVGPSSDSQREAAQEFLRGVVGNLGNLPVAPQQAAKLLALSIQMQQMGPRGDMMAEIISPTNQGQQLPPQVQQMQQQMQQEMQQLHAYAQQLEQKIVELQREKEGKVVDNEYRLKLEQMKIEAQLTVAEINTKSQALSERVSMINDIWAQLHDHSHEAALQVASQGHEAAMQAMQHGQEGDQQAADQQHEAGMQDAQQAHEAQLAQQQAAQQPQQPEG